MLLYDLIIIRRADVVHWLYRYDCKYMQELFDDEYMDGCKQIIST
jgi:hypothetical protein